MKESKPSLFAFQDIITSVIGIFVFISILLMLSISAETAAFIEEKQEVVEFDASKLRDDISDLEAMNKLLKAKRDKMQETKDMCDDISENIENLKVEISEIEKEIDEIQSVEIAEISTESLEEFVREGQARVDKLLRDKKALMSEREKLLSAIQADIKLLDDEVKKYKDGAVFINSKNTVANKNILFIDSGQKGFKVLSKTGFMSLSEFEIYIYSLDAKSYFLQFLCRPSSGHFYFPITKLCQDANIEYGLTMILEEEAILDE